MRSGARLLLASLNFGSGLLPLALGTVAPAARLLSLSASVLPGDQSNDHLFNVSDEQAIQKKHFHFLIKDVPKTLLSHLQAEENVPEGVSVCIHISSLLSLLKLARLCFYTSVFSSDFQVNVGIGFLRIGVNGVPDMGVLGLLLACHGAVRIAAAK